MIILILCGLFVLFAGMAIFLGYKQFHLTLENELISDRTVVNMAAMVLQEHEKATKGILQSYASRPLFVDSVRLKDVAGVERHLADLKKNNPEMDLTFLTDAKGINVEEALL